MSIYFDRIIIGDDMNILKKVLKVLGIILLAVILFLIVDYIRLNIRYFIHKDEYEEVIDIHGNKGSDVPQGLSYSEKYDAILQTSYSTLSTYNKILKTKEIRDLYNSLKDEASMTDVKDYVIYQPEDSKEGDKYLVLLQQLSGKRIVREDIQFLICTEGHQQEVVKEVKEIKKATALPRTFDSIILLVVLAVITIIAIAVILRIKKLSKNEK